MPACRACSTDLAAGERSCPRCGAAAGPEASVSALETRAGHDRAPTPGARRDRTPSDVVHGRFLPGTIFAERFRIAGLLGQGGMGEVYRADDLTLGQQIAIKFLPPRFAHDKARLLRLRDEV